MNRFRFLLHTFFFIILLNLIAAPLFAQARPPQPEKRTKVFTEHGRQRIDEFFWLSNPNDPAVISHLNEENAYTESMLRPTEPLQKKIYDELIARIEQRYESLPTRENGYWYYTRFEEGNQYPFYCRKRGNMQAQEKIFLDANALAKGYQIYMIRGTSVSPDAQWLAYGVDTAGDRRSRLFISELSSGALRPEIIPNTSGDYAWSADSKTIFYVLNDPTVRAYRVMRHVAGTDPTQDVRVYEEADSTFSVHLSTTRDNRFIVITSWSTMSSECRLLPTNHPEESPSVIQSRMNDLLYSVVEHEDGVIYLRTNDRAPNFKLSTVTLAKPGREQWVDVLPHRSDAFLEGAIVLRGYTIAQRKINGLTNILVIDRRTQATHEVAFDEQAYVADMSLATDATDADSIRFTYSSLTIPATDYRYDLSTRSKTMLKQEKVGGGYESAQYETRRVWAAAGENVRVPISLVYKKSLFKTDGSNPALLYAYGSYGATTDPYFDRSVISLLDRGFVYAIAHVRGGQELGRKWYDDGKVLTKINTFTDFIACAEHLVRERFTSRDRLFANGVSAGGMLMGAVTNMRPDLFRGILAEVPWTDVITDMFNTDLPLTTLEFDEWGNPAQKEQYDYMLRWSPYDNMHPAAYPAILATGGLNDTQVPYYSPAKWVARLRENNTGTNPILFRCNMGAGHSGESGRFVRQKLTALKYAFMLDVLGRSDGGK